MKNLVCYFLMMVFALMSGGVNAHDGMGTAPVAAQDHLHGHHDHQPLQHALPDVQHPTVDADTVVLAEAQHTDTCSHSHCGHNHAAGMMAAQSACIPASAAIAVSTSGTSWASSAITENIERPKWLFSTSSVVSLLT